MSKKNRTTTTSHKTTTTSAADLTPEQIAGAAKTPKAKKSPRDRMEARLVKVSRSISKLLKPLLTTASVHEQVVEASGHLCLAIENLQCLPNTWGAKVKAAKPSKDIAVGDHVSLKANGKVRAIYGESIMAAELDDLVVEKIGKLVRCITPTTKATVFIPLRHLAKIDTMTHQEQHKALEEARAATAA